MSQAEPRTVGGGSTNNPAGPRASLAASRYEREAVHGADDPNVLKLNANEGSRPPAELFDVLVDLGPDVLRGYPDPTPLEVDLAARFEIDPSRVVVTAGAGDALDRTCRAFLGGGREMVLPVPTFEMFHHLAAIGGGRVIEVDAHDEFSVDRVLAAVTAETALIVVVSPNNPTGRVLSIEQAVELADGAPGALVLFDLAYVEYADDDPTRRLLELPNALVYRTFSKAWGLAGCRVGYVLCPGEAAGGPEIASTLRQAGPPYPVTAPSLALARACLAEDRDRVEAHLDRVRDERSRLTERLEAWNVEVPRSQGNFVCPDFGSRLPLVSKAFELRKVIARAWPHRPQLASSLRISLPDSGADVSFLEAALALALEPEALLFDLDGVLANVEESYRECVLETVQSFGVALDRSDLQAAVAAGGANNDWQLSRRLLADRGVEVSLAEVTEIFQRIYLGTTDRPGLVERERLTVPIEWIRKVAADRPLAIVTGRPRAEAVRFLDRFGLTELLVGLVTMEDGPAKPDPTPVRLAMETLGVERAWMIGDTPDDVRAAAAAGVIPLGIVAPGDESATATAALLEAGAALVLDDLTQLEELLP